MPLETDARGPDVPTPISGSRRTFLVRAGVVAAAALVLSKWDLTYQPQNAGRKAVRFEDIDPREPILGKRVLFRVPSEGPRLPGVEVQLLENHEEVLLRIDGMTYEFGERLGREGLKVARTIRREGDFLRATHPLGTGKTSAGDVAQTAHLVRTRSSDETGIIQTEIAGSFQLHFCRESHGSHAMTLRRRTDMDQTV